MCLKEIGVNTRNWVDSAQDRDYLRALVNAELNPGFHKPWSWLVGRQQISSYKKSEFTTIGLGLTMISLKALPIHSSIVDSNRFL